MTHVAVLLILAFIVFSHVLPNQPINSFDFGDDEFGLDSQDLTPVMIASKTDENGAESAASEDDLLQSPSTLSDSLLSNDFNNLDEPTLEQLLAPNKALTPSTNTFVKLMPLGSESGETNTAGGLFPSSGLGSRALAGRSSDQRGRLAIRRGGSQQSELAVERGLQWLAIHQSTNGSWSTFMSDKPCNGRCSHGSVDERSAKRVGATGLALLCFLGAGHTHRQGDYKAEVYKAIMFLLDQMHRGGDAKTRDAGRFLTDRDAFEMYEQGIATLALCEALQMTDDKLLRKPCQEAVDFLYRVQDSDGSWGYQPHSTGDLSIVSWQIMALKSAHACKLNVRASTLAKADEFITSQQSNNGAYYGYRSTSREPGTTAIGLLLRMVRGWSKTDPRLLRGVAYIEELGPSTDGVYYNYYATQVLFHLEDERFKKWNPVLRDYLVREQAKEGHEAGSWFFPDKHFNEIGGRLYCTAMSLLTLEVYYRYSPMYEDLDDNRFEF